MEIVETNFEESTIDYTYSRASTIKRFLNYIIDLIVYFVLIFLFGILAALESPSNLRGFASSGMTGQILCLSIYVVYMSMTEATLGGKSIGKFITGTKALNLDGTNLSIEKAFLRGIIRVVPFCAFSAFGSPCDPWQDRWSNTMVIDDKKVNQIESVNY